MTQQFWIPGTAGDWSTAADWQSGVVPTATDDAVIDISNAVTVNGLAVANSLILNISTLTISGSLTIGTSLTFTGYSDELILNGGTLSAQSIASPNPYSGYIYGYGTINAALTGDMVIYATGGTLNLQGSIADDAASLVVNIGATLELGEGTSSPVHFAGPSGTLRLDVPAAFTGSIYATAGDAIDLVGVSASSATYSGTTLTINETNGQHLTYNVSASIGGTLTIAPDGAGGTNVYWPLTVSWNGTAGDWSTWANWSPEVVPTSIDNAVINSSNAVTVNGAAVANALTLDNSDLTVSGTLTLGTSLTLDGGSHLMLSGGTLSAQSITSDNENQGTLQGYGTVSGAVSGFVAIGADGGTLTVQGSLAGDTGYFQIEAGAILELSNGASQTVEFEGNLATLRLDAPATFTGSIENINLGNTIDLAGITASSATYIGTTLTINETNGQQLTYNNVSGNVAGDIVQVASDNNGGTLVYWTQPAVTESLVDDTGSSSTDKITSNDELTGSGDPNAVVNFTVDGKSITTTATANSNGIWTFTPSGLADGSHTVVASETDSGGHTVTASLTFTLDTTAPTVAITSAGSLTNHTTQTISGTIDTADANLTVSIYEGSTLIGAATPLANGTWTTPVTLLSTQGEQAITAEATDAAGNLGTSSPVTYTLDTIAPVVAITSTGGLTNDPTQTVRGTVDVADTGTIVTLYDGTTVLGTAIVQPNGSWNYTVTLPTNGANTLTALDTDAAGNTGTSNAVVYTLDTTPPTVASISATTDNKTTDVNAGHVVTITMTTSEAVTVIGTPTLQLNDNEVATYTTGSGSNTLTFTYTVRPGDNVADLQVTGINLPPGASIEDQATNALSGSVTGNLGIQIDTTAPAVTERLFSDTGSSSTDKITSNDELTGASDPNAVVHFTVDGKPITATATANSSGTWTFTPTGLADGVHTIVASETDAAGNTGTTSLTFTLDTTAPVPVISSEVLSSGKVTLTGTTAEANDPISIYDGTTLLGTTTTASNGTWSFTTAKVSNVVHTYTATATDVAGNVGHSSNEAILGSTSAATLVGTSGNDIIIGNGGNDTITGGLGADTLTGGSGHVTFIYNSISDSTPSSHDTITDFSASRDIIDFTNIAGINATNHIPTFQGQLTGSGNLSLHAHSVAYIEVGGNTEVLVNTTSTTETVTSANVSAANMEIVLVGIHLGLKSADFYHV